jgi:hypothetical protein
VPPVSQIQERDQAILRAWIDGARQADLAVQYQVAPSSISRAISRAVAALPPRDKAAEVHRALDMIHDLEAVYLPKALAGSVTANRELRGLLALRGRYLGIDRREVLVEHGGQVQHTWTPGPTVAEVMAEVMDQYQKQGMIQAQATRMDK